MNTHFKLLSLFAVAALALAACGKENGGEKGRPDDGTRAVSITVSQNQPRNTKAAIGEEPPITGEDELQSALYVYVVNVDAQTLEVDGMPVVLGGGGKATSTFRVTLGKKRFYVFSMTDAMKAMVDANIAGITVFSSANFEKVVMASGLTDGVGNDVPANIATPYGTPGDTGFMIGSLWGQTLDIPAANEGDDDDPVELTLTIGRVAAKVKILGPINYDNTGKPYTGDFTRIGSDAPKYRPGAVAKNFHLVGQHEGSLNPDYSSYTGPNSLGGIVVYSAVHDAPWGTAGTPNEWNTSDFKKNTDYGWKSINNNVTSTNDFWYLVENTTNPLRSGVNNMSYGNTTFLQTKIQYIPGDGEVVNVSAGAPAGETSLTMGGAALLTDNHFWVGWIGTKRFIFDADPTTDMEIDALLRKGGGFDPVQYVNGMNYYKFPIQEQDETLGICKYRVLRNFSYQFTIEDILDLGSSAPEVDPGEEIERDFNMKIKVEKTPWSTVTGGIILG